MLKPPNFSLARIGSEILRGNMVAIVDNNCTITEKKMFYMFLLQNRKIDRSLCEMIYGYIRLEVVII